MTASAAIYQRMSMDRLQEHAATEGEHQDEAARAYVERLLDLEVERRLVLLHERPGWHSCSPGFGDGTGPSTTPTDSMYLAYIKGIRLGGWHEAAKRALSQIRERGRLAVLIQAAKSDRRLDGPFAATHDEIAANLGHYAQMLGWPPGVAVVHNFEKGQAIKRAAHQSKVKMLLLAKAGVM